MNTIIHDPTRGWLRKATPIVVTEELKERFFRNVKKTKDCWLWTGTRSHMGYGKMSVKNKLVNAHRISYCIHKGEIGRLCVCHTCDNTSCVNPDHLWAGTTIENNQDRDRKGRHVIGRAKLTRAQVLRIRKSDMIYDDIAKEFNISTDTVYRIKKRLSWKKI